MIRFLTCSAAALAFLAPAAFADNRALIVANENYVHAADISAADDVLDAEGPLAEAGFAVATVRDGDATAMRMALSGLLENREAAERIVIVLAGHFAQSERGTWFLASDADAPDLASADGAGLPLATILEIASGAPGGALVLLGSEERRIDLGTGIGPGIGVLDIPQGVTVIRGDADMIAAFAARDVPLRGQSVARMLASRPELVGEGFLSELAPFLPAEDADGGDTGIDAVAAETAFWEATRNAGTPEAYDGYLARYPQGRFAAEARAEAERIRAEPGREARLAEEALGLTRDQRRAIQRSLSILDFDPRGIDGLFGRGSRTAISAWQGARGAEATGYLTRDQVAQLSAEADRRAAELELEAKRRQEEQERQDRAYWDQTGAKGDEAGLRAYIKRYPDGLYAELAQDRIDAIEAERRDAAAAQDRQAWDKAEAADTIEAYRAYLAGYPNGAFANEAKARVDALTGAPVPLPGAPDPDQAAQEREAALGLNQVTRNLVEARLQSLGLKPGKVDGRIDEDTRRAIRRFQRARDLEVTGYLDQPTMVRLLTGGVLP